MRRESFSAAARLTPLGRAAEAVVHDREWGRGARTALVAGLGVLTATLVLDGCDGDLNAVRTLLWAALAVLLFAVLLPPRTTAGDGWLAVRGPLRERRIRTDLLVGVRFEGAVARRLILRDAFGTRVELDPGVLHANPLLWHELDTGARRARAAGLLPPGNPALRELAAAIDDRQSRELLTTAGLD